MIVPNKTEFKAHQKLMILSRHNSQVKILICTNDAPDFWLLDIVKFWNTNNQVCESFQITKNDLPAQLEHWKNKGYNRILIRKQALSILTEAKTRV
ncbi:MAG: hypothetical protein JXB00_09450 [Bacteroidales bacterium]|nr:hypothetical protein [Bacteroidales bacterium]